AIGSEPIVPPIPGAYGKNVISAVDVYGNEDKVAYNTVIVGGGEVGVETGLHLAEKGRKVTILEMLDRLASEAAPLHYSLILLEAVEKQKNLKYILNARCTNIHEKTVTYVDRNNLEHKIEADTIVISVGMKPKTEETFKLTKELAEAGVKFYIVGDCAQTKGNIQKAIRSAYAAAASI
ncbi:MAG: FAD-dependent oxidoreductase, partial [Candidatus Bathyarchaeia archaeon]